MAWSISGQPEYVKSACDASLKRLGIDHIDLYYQHRVDPQVPIEDTVVRHGRTRSGRQSEISGPLRGIAQNHSTGPRGSSHYRPAN